MKLKLLPVLCLSTLLFSCSVSYNSAVGLVTTKTTSSFHVTFMSFKGSPTV